MSVKSKIKRLNRQIEILRKENILQVDHILQLEVRRNDKSKREEMLENIIKFAITNHVGGLHAGMAIDWFGIDKMKDLKLDIEKNAMEHAYIMRVRY